MNDLTTAGVRKFKDAEGNYMWQPSIQVRQPANPAEQLSFVRPGRQDMKPGLALALDQRHDGGGGAGNHRGVGPRHDFPVPLRPTRTVTGSSSSSTSWMLLKSLILIRLIMAFDDVAFSKDLSLIRWLARKRSYFAAASGSRLPVNQHATRSNNLPADDLFGSLVMRLRLLVILGQSAILTQNL
jgi:hypothetical protein